MLLSLIYPLSVAAETTTPQDESVAQSTQTPPTDTPTPALTSEPSTDSPATPQTTQETDETTPPSPTNSSAKTSDQNSPASPNAPSSTTSTGHKNTTPLTQTPPTTHSNETSDTETSVNNTIDSTATSGDATAAQNTTVADVTSGNATALATIVNLLQSSVNLNGAQPIVFVQDVTGTVNGNLLIDPETLANSLGSTAPLYGNETPSNIDTSAQATINNIINLNATSGDATAAQNTTAGNVQSGSANAVANVVNLINSAINANQSFIGMINIHGNLNGDILVPAEFVNSVLGTGTSTNNMQGANVTTDGTASVTNHINTSAQSGAASSISNSTSGNVGTGEANTNVTILNLTSNQTTSKNALLVFVNVMGKWVGLILDAPAGTTSASLGNNDATHGVNTDSTDINAASNLQINNTINASATSGNAIGKQNTTVGNINSGSANTGVNLLNILNSQISLSDWFGILFINVFGEWVGNFGTQTTVATEPPPSTPSQSGSNQNSSSNNGSANTPRAALTFVTANSQHRTSHKSSRTFSTVTSYLTGFDDGSNSDGGSMSFYAPQSVLSSSTSGDDSNNDNRDIITLQSDKKNTVEDQGLQQWLIPLGLVALGLVLLYYLARRKEDDESDTEI